MRTERGEISILVESLRLLTKAIRPLPDQWSGLKDREQVLRIYQELKGRDPKLAAAFFRRNVLPKAEATAQPKKMSQRDQLLRILRNAPIDDATRQDAWDTFYQASSPDDFIARIDKLNIPDTVKRSIYDLRFRKP